MLDIRKLTPWEFYELEKEKPEDLILNEENLQEQFWKWFFQKPWEKTPDWAKLAEQLKEPIYEKYIESFHTGYLCTESILPGLCILKAAEQGKTLYIDGDLLDDEPVEFLAMQEKQYTVNLWMFSLFYARISDEAEKRITLNGKHLSWMDTTDYLFEVPLGALPNEYCPDCFERSREHFEKEYSRLGMNYSHDAFASYPAGEFFYKKRWDKDLLRIFDGYELQIHSDESLVWGNGRWPLIFAALEYADGRKECEMVIPEKNPFPEELLDTFIEHFEQRQYSRGIYVMWDTDSLKTASLDIVSDADLFFEINSVSKQVLVYTKGWRGERRFYDFYHDDFRFIDPEYADWRRKVMERV